LGLLLLEAVVQQVTPELTNHRSFMTSTAQQRVDRLAQMPFQVSASRDATSVTGRLWAPIVEIFAHRELLGLLVRRELKARYKDSSLGFLWSLIKPLTMLLIYYVAIGHFLGAARGIPDFAIFVFAGLTIWGLDVDSE
jgi:ABC-2 type transport system permease protein